MKRSGYVQSPWSRRQFNKLLAGSALAAGSGFAGLAAAEQPALVKATRLFIDWVMGLEGSGIVAANGGYPADSETIAPEEMPPRKSIKAWAWDPRKHFVTAIPSSSGSRPKTIMGIS